MTEFQYPPFVLPLIPVAIIALAFAYLIWQRRPGAGVVSFALMMVSIGEWTVADIIMHLGTDAHFKVVFLDISYLGISLVPVFWFLFASEYTGRDRWINRRTLSVLAIPPLFTTLSLLTNPLHHGFRGAPYLERSGDFVTVESEVGILFWIHATFAYTLLVAGTALLVVAYVRSPKVYRAQFLLLLLGAIIPWIANVTYIFGGFRSPVDPTVIGFLFTGLIMGWSVYRYRLLDLVPVARVAILESMNDAVMVLDRQDRIVDMNPAGLRLVNQTSAEALIGKLPREIMPQYMPLLDQYRTVTEANAEITLGTPEVSQRTFDMRISPLRTRQGELSGRVFVLRDITALRMAAAQIQQQNDALVKANTELGVANQKAEEANRLKSEFLATMSHELRTPLNSVIGYTDLMMTGITGTLTPKQEDYVRRIMSNGERLLKLINDILDISKIEAGRMELVIKPISPADLLAEVAARMQSLADQRSLKLETRLDPALPPQVMGDQGRLEQILTNLVGNAIRFTDAGEVAVRLNADSDHWVVEVCDTGRGIPPHALEFIFDEFRQVDGSPQREHGGTGLGLAIVRKLVVMMQGTIHVESEVGKGSTFRVRLPLAVPEAATQGS